MRILIMVLSYDKPPFSDFMETQQETWDLIDHPGVDVIYYFGKTGSTHNSKELQVNCSDDYEMMHWKFKLALDQIHYKKYDFIFRTNSCSYIVKDKIIEVAKSLPCVGCYAGYHNGSYISGAGIFFSPDVLDILRDELTEERHGAEDVLIGQILSNSVPMTAENSRIDAKIDGVQNFDSYHFRFKTSNNPEDRYRDINNMKILHRKLLAR